MKQKEFFLACIQNALADEAEELLKKPNRKLRRSRRICRKKTNKIKLVRRRMTRRRFFLKEITLIIYPENLKAKPMLWLWLLRDIAILGVCLILSVLALARGSAWPLW